MYDELNGFIYFTDFEGVVKFLDGDPGTFLDFPPIKHSIETITFSTHSISNVDLDHTLENCFPFFSPALSSSQT